MFIHSRPDAAILCLIGLPLAILQLLEEYAMLKKSSHQKGKHLLVINQSGAGRQSSMGL